MILFKFKPASIIFEMFYAKAPQRLFETPRVIDNWIHGSLILVFSFFIRDFHVFLAVLSETLLVCKYLSEMN
jgi:hypothetical protein